MKKLITLIIGILIFSSTYAQHQQIINGNFEEWGSYTFNGTIPTTIDTATNWNNFFIYSNFLIKTATKSSDYHQGNYAVKIETYNNSGTVIPGIFLLGDISLTAQSKYKITGGQAFSDKPFGFKTFVKYLPAEGDTGFVYCYLTKWNGTTTDTVAASLYPLFDSIINYKEISAPFLYKTGTDSICDTINVIYTSSSIYSPKIGSTLYADSISLIYDWTPYPTLALPATDTTDNSFDANWILSPYSSEYYIDVAYDSIFSNMLSGYDNKLISFIKKDNFTNYSLKTTVNIPSKTDYYYRIRVKYGDTLTSINSNIIGVHLTEPVPIREISDFKDFKINNKILILFNVDVNSNIQIFDLSGKNLYSETNNNETIYIPFTNSGVFILKITSRDKIETLKFKID